MKSIPTLLASLGVLCTFSTPAQIRADFTFTNKQHMVIVPFDYWNDHMYVKLRLNNSEVLDFLFDPACAASGILVDPTVAAQANLPEGDSTTLTLRTLVMEHQKISLVSMKKWEALRGHKMDGILGYSFIRDFVVRVDPKNKRLIITDPLFFADRTLTGKVELVNIDQNRVPVVKGSLTTRDHTTLMADFAIDPTDNEPLVLGKKFVEKNKPANDTNDVNHWVSSVRFGSYSIAHPAVRYAYNPGGIDPQRDGCLLGAALFKDKTITFNYARGYVIISD